MNARVGLLLFKVPGLPALKPGLNTPPERAGHLPPPLPPRKPARQSQELSRIWTALSRMRRDRSRQRPAPLPDRAGLKKR